MPIYEYRCRGCGFEKEYLQKLSDPAISDCPSCGKAEMVKLVSAAGFQLKGSGWYVTDFKNGSKPGAGAGKAEGKDEGKSESKDASKAESTPDSKAESKPESKPESKAASGDAAPAGSTGASPA